MICVDSSVWIDYFNGKITDKTNWLDSALGEKEIVIGDIILTEVLQGFKDDGDFKIAKDLLSQFPYIDMVGHEIAIKSAMNFRALRKRGITVRKTIDLIIATFCIHYDFFLLHDDRDFEPMEKYLRLKTVVI